MLKMVVQKSLVFLNSKFFLVSEFGVAEADRNLLLFFYSKYRANIFYALTDALFFVCVLLSIIVGIVAARVTTTHKHQLKLLND